MPASGGIIYNGLTASTITHTAMTKATKQGTFARPAPAAQLAWRVTDCIPRARNPEIVTHWYLPMFPRLNLRTTHKSNLEVSPTHWIYLCFLLLRAKSSRG